MRPRSIPRRTARFTASVSAGAIAVLLALVAGRAGATPSAPAVRAPSWALAGGTWSDAFSAPTFDGAIDAMIDCRGALLAGGRFHRVGRVATTHVAAWDGTAWAPLGAGLDGPVRAFVLAFNGVVAAGDFERSGATPCHHLALWDGARWSAIGAGLDGSVQALIPTDSGFVAAGRFALPGDPTPLALASWDGRGWRALAPAVSDSIQSAVRFQGREILVLTHASEPWKFDYAVVRRGNASWDTLGTGTCPDDWPPHLVAHGDQLYLAGFFGDDRSTCLMRFVGGSWTADNRVGGVAVRAQDTPAGPALFGSFGDWTVDRGYLVVVYPAGPRYIAGAPYPEPTATAMWGSQLVSVGKWMFLGMTPSAAPATCPVALDDWRWSELRDDAGAGAGLRVNGAGVALTGLFESADTLFAFGPRDQRTFRDGGWQAPAEVASWDGARWQWSGALPLDPSCAARFRGDVFVGEPYRDPTYDAWIVRRCPVVSDARLGSGIDGPARTLLETPRALVVAGDFRTAGGLRVPGLAMWDGAAWSAFPGLDSTARVSALARVDSTLWIAGELGPPGRLARWDGTALVPVAAATTRRIDVLGAYAGHPAAAGAFVIDGAPFEGVAALEGDAWRALAAPGVALRGVRALSGTGAALYALADLAAEGVDLGRGVARWDGSSWSSLGADVDGPDSTAILSILARDDGLWMAGRFSSVAGVSSYGVARWIPPAPQAAGAAPSLAAAAPNPFADAAEIAFALPRAAAARLTVHDIAGRRVAVLVDGSLAAGPHHVRWDGRDGGGRATRAGVYLLRLEVAGEAPRVSRIVRLR